MPATWEGQNPCEGFRTGATLNAEPLRGCGNPRKGSSPLRRFGTALSRIGPVV